jgi:hypothetical protein
MLLNHDEPWARERLDRTREAMPEMAILFAALADDPNPYSLQDKGEGLVFASEKPVDGRPNRARVKVFTVTDGPMKNRRAVFFYKESQVPFSHDRHSYGVCLPPTSGPVPADVRAWLRFATTGFDPAERPESLRLAFAFTVPD